MEVWNLSSFSILSLSLFSHLVLQVGAQVHEEVVDDIGLVALPYRVQVEAGGLGRGERE